MRLIFGKWKFFRIGTDKKQSGIIKKLCWKGIPPNLRGSVWLLLIGNHMKISTELYKICCIRANSSEIINNMTDLISIDIDRTFPNLAFFQKEGPNYNDLKSILEAYICFRPDIGYVQGMSFIAAVLSLQMDSFNSFVSMANMFGKEILMSFYTFNIIKIKKYCLIHEEFLELYFPDIYKHFTELKIKTDTYFIIWIMTLFGRSLPLDIVVRIWDIYLNDYEITIFRVALTIIAYNKDFLVNANFEEIMNYLGNPSDLEEKTFFDVMSNYKIPSIKVIHALRKYNLDYQ